MPSDDLSAPFSANSQQYRGIATMQDVLGFASELKNEYSPTIDGTGNGERSGARKRLVTGTQDSSMVAANG